MAVKVAVAATILSLSLKNSCIPAPRVSPASLIPEDVGTSDAKRWAREGGEERAFGACLKTAEAVVGWVGGRVGVHRLAGVSTLGTRMHSGTSVLDSTKFGRARCSLT